MLLAASIGGLFLLPGPWNIILFCFALVIEVGELYLWKRFLDRYRVRGGIEGMIGERAVVLKECDPAGLIRLRGETWHADVEGGARIGAGETATVTSVEGLRVKIRALD